MAWESLNDYRWWLVSGIPHPTINVIEPAVEEAERPAGRRVPFGFSRVLDLPPTEVDPLLWEGED